MRMLNFTNNEEHVINANFFPKMSNLHFLILDGCYVVGDLDRISEELRWLQWRFIPLTHLPPISNLFNLISLDLSLSDNLANAWVITDSTLKVCYANLLLLKFMQIYASLCSLLKFMVSSKLISNKKLHCENVIVNINFSMD